MAISPFSTLEEFNQAAAGPTEGAIYTFAQSPVIISIAIVVSALIFCWFIYTTFTVNHSSTEPETRSPVHYGVMIIAGLLSLAGGLYSSQRQPQQEARAQPTTPAPQPKQTPVVLFGLTSLSALPTYRQFRRAQRRSRLRRKWRIR